MYYQPAKEDQVKKITTVNHKPQAIKPKLPVYPIGKVTFPTDK